MTKKHRVRYGNRKVNSEGNDIWQCAWMRYKKPEITQRHISVSLGMSEAKISRLLRKADEQGLLKTTLSINPPRIAELEAELREKFELFDAVVTPTCIDTPQDSKKIVGIAAARYIEPLIREGSRVGIGPGSTLTQVVENLTPKRFQNLKLYPLAAMEDLGKDTAEVVEFFPNTLVAAMRSKYGGEVQAYNFKIAPVGRELTDQEKEEVLQQNGIKELFEEAKNADLFLLGIGTYRHIGATAEAVLRHYHTDIKKLKKMALGYINFQPFDSERVLAEEFAGISNIIALPIDHLRKMSKTPGKHVIAIAAGEEKVEAVNASLSPNIRCFDVLVTDGTIAEKVLASKRNA